MTGNKNIAVSEQLREALLDSERASRKERELRLETETLLEGLDILINYHDSDKMFEKILEALRKLINFEDAFILTSRENGLQIVASTSPRFQNMNWHQDKAMTRISIGKPLAFFDISAVPEWQSQPMESRDGVCSAIHVLLREHPKNSILICTHSKRGFFSDKHLRLSTRFAPLASQALTNLESFWELEKINDQLKKTQAQVIVKSKMAALGEMANGVAHEINNPLTIIQTQIEYLGRNAKTGHVDPESTLKVVDVIVKTVKRLAKVSSGLRTFAGDGERELMRNVPVEALLEDTLVLCKEKFVSHGIQFDLSIPVATYEHLTVDCRRTEICQVLVNLLNNSYDAIETLENKWIRLEIRDQGDFIEINVIDSGDGIPMDIQEKVMQPFFTTKEAGKGTGLGLSISKGIIDGHRGELFVDNNCENTKITMRLPKKQTVWREHSNST